MADDLYERYKDALRTGHVAVLRGRLQDAETSYLEASAIAPSRPLPHVALGGVYLRMSRLDDALERYGIALQLSPRDEGALFGQAEVLSLLGRVADAAAALDAVADLQEATDRLPEATETLARALELEETPERLHRHRARLRELELSTSDGDAERALGRALRILDYAGATSVTPPPDGGSEGTAGAATVDGGPAAGEEAGAGAETSEPTAADAVAVAAAAPAEPGPDGRELAMQAEDALSRGDAAAGRRLLVEAARAFGQAGLDDAALDAADRALELAPEDADLHLALVGLYVGRGWRGLAAEKLVLLGRLVDLEGDASAREQVCAVARDLFPDEPRLREFCQAAT